MDGTSEGKCHFLAAPHGRRRRLSEPHWWPNQLRVDLLNQHSSKSDPLGQTSTIVKSSKTSTSGSEKRPAQADDRISSWWPADFGHYGQR